MAKATCKWDIEAYKIGDRVKIKNNDVRRELVGMTGTIRGFRLGLAAVEFDEERDEFHRCGEMCDDKHGYFLSISRLAKVGNNPRVTNR